MTKILKGPLTLIQPLPLLLVGANVNGKPNFMTVAWGGIANGEPPMISIAIRHQRYTRSGIMQHMSFSVNIPSIDLVRETDYCGMVSGSEVDKAEACQFEVFYGKLANAPLIKQCPINLECKVLHVLDLGSHSFFVGRIEETHISDSCLTDGEQDVTKIKPLIYEGSPGRRYFSLGHVIGNAGSIGEELGAR